MKSKPRYALLTIDTEALPKRAASDHVKRLMWGEHANGTAGVREMCGIADDVGAKLVFFVDPCGAYHCLDELADVIRWLDGAGQDVQLHSHSDYLPPTFWTEHGFAYRPRFLNQYDAEKALFTMRHFSAFLSGITGKAVRAFRAGSFRWNADTIRALHGVGIPLSFNNSMHAFQSGQCVYGEPTNLPYLWSNGVIEVPVTEYKYPLFPFGREWWGRLQFPSLACIGRPLGMLRKVWTRGREDSFLVMLLHSWSLLYWDDEGHAEYRDDRRIEEFRKLMRRLAKDYDIITTADFLDLYARGDIAATHTTELSVADLKPGASRSVR